MKESERKKERGEWENERESRRTREGGERERERDG